MSRQNSMSSTFTGNGNKEYTIVPTETLSGYKEIWPKPYVPPLDHAKLADDVGRDLAVKAELAYVKAISTASSQSEANAIRVEWEKTQLNKHGGPTVLAPRAEDVSAMQGYDLAEYMPRRGDFDIEWDNDAEKLLQDMEFLPEDTADDRALKVKVLAIYNSRLCAKNDDPTEVLKWASAHQCPWDERECLCCRKTLISLEKVVPSLS